jgi:transposase
LKTSDEIRALLEAYDSTGGLRAAAALTGCDHKTVARYVALREAGHAPDRRPRRAQSLDGFLPQIEEWVHRSHGRIRADRVHEKLTAMGFTGSQRTTRRTVAEVKAAWRTEHRQVFRPWRPEPGLWLQFDWAVGPRVAGRSALLFSAWLAWSRFRVVLPVREPTLPTLLACLQTTARRIGGAPAYVLTEEEKTVTVGDVARVPVRHTDVVTAGRHCGMTIRSCLPADPQAAGGSAATVRIAAADLVPTRTDLRADYAGFVDLQAACHAFGLRINARPDRTTGRAPVELLAEEATRLRALPVAGGGRRPAASGDPRSRFAAAAVGAADDR